MSHCEEVVSMKGARFRIIDPKRSNVGASLDLSKASPSNGQCPTAVSSRDQTIPSREYNKVVVAPNDMLNQNSTSNKLSSFH